MNASQFVVVFSVASVTAQFAVKRRDHRSVHIVTSALVMLLLMIRDVIQLTPENPPQKPLELTRHVKAIKC